MTVQASTGDVKSCSRCDRATVLQLPLFQNPCDDIIIIVSFENCIQLLLRWFEKFALSKMKNVVRFIQKKRGVIMNANVS